MRNAAPNVAQCLGLQAFITEVKGEGWASTQGHGTADEKVRSVHLGKRNFLETFFVCKGEPVYPVAVVQHGGWFHILPPS
uniref:Uncharacterized protein n=1 Tax=Engystomops pustulosus TaxID=76066 RepID=A0AAV6YNI3_ENGPU|nr:hypothetical protein GDO81_025651 [Engystomops pustulosus]